MFHEKSQREDDRTLVLLDSPAPLAIFRIYFGELEFPSVIPCPMKFLLLQFIQVCMLAQQFLVIHIIFVGFILLVDMR